MKGIRRLLAAGCAALVCCAALAAPPSPAAFGALPKKVFVDLSPNGHAIAWGEPTANGHNVIAMDLATGKVLKGVPVTGRTKLRDVRWADDDVLLVTFSAYQEIAGNTRARYEFRRTVAFDVKTGTGATLLIQSNTAMSGNTGAAMIASRLSKAHTVLMSAWDWNGADERQQTGSRISGGRRDSGYVSRIFEVDTRTGAGTLLATGSQFTYDWVVDRDGRVLARADWEPEQKRCRILARDGAGWREIYRRDDGEQATIASVSTDGAHTLVLAHADDGRNRLWVLALDGSGLKPFFIEDEPQVEGWTVDRFDHTPVAVHTGGVEQKVRWIDSRAQQLSERVGRAFPGRRVTLYGRSADRTRALAYVDSPNLAPVYYLVDFSTKRADIFGEQYPALADVPLGHKEPTTYAARDGTPIPAYVTWPPGVERKNLPMVVLPHGGPESRDDADFDWLAQFYATRGWLVLQPQFRGSTGFGEEFRKAGHRQWGGLMQDDVSDGVAAYVKSGAIDPRRVCIVGASYGGYAALAGAAFTPDLYACAVSIAGVSDLPEMLGYMKNYHGDDSDSFAYWKDHIGSATDVDVARRSPARRTSGIRAPVLLLHGEQDTVVPIGQSEAMNRALRQANKSVEFVKLPGEDHWLSREETRVRVLQETEKFLARYLGPAPN